MADLVLSPSYIVVRSRAPTVGCQIGTYSAAVGRNLGTQKDCNWCSPRSVYGYESCTYSVRWIRISTAPGVQISFKVKTAQALMHFTIVVDDKKKERVLPVTGFPALAIVENDTTQGSKTSRLHSQYLTKVPISE